MNEEKKKGEKMDKKKSKFASISFSINCFLSDVSRVSLIPFFSNFNCLLVYY